MSAFRITLHGTNEARFADIHYKARGMGGPIGPLARRLIETRAAKPFDEVEVYRGDTICFKAMPLIWWASMACTETAATSARLHVYKPLPEGAFA